MCRRLYLLLVIIAFTAGCGRGNGRCGLAGSVLLDGGPIQRGSIDFTPVAGPVLTTAGSMIIDGRYAVAAKQGLLPGTYRVRVFWPEVPAGPGILDGVSSKPPRERVPERYNAKSDLLIELTAKGPNEFDFDLKAQPP
jgi:hypothetical protein